MAEVTMSTTADGGSPQLVAGRYEFWRRIGQGGMGEVYEGLDTKLERPVALKCPPKEVSINPRSRKRFLYEARTMAKLRHPHIVQVYDVVEEEDTNGLWIVMDFIEGWSASAWLDEHERFEVEKAAAIAIQVCEGLAHAHEAGVVHRDIKPSNIMFDKAGWAWVMDLGIAREIKNTVYTLTGEQTSGTLAYMAPEQHLGQDRDPRVDIYALGATLYEMVTGQMPFEGIPDLRAAKLAGAFAAPRELRDDLPEALESIILRCMATERAERYGDAETLAAAMRSCRLKLDIPAAPAQVAPPSGPRQTDPGSELVRVAAGNGAGPVSREASGPLRGSSELEEVCRSDVAELERIRMRGRDQKDFVKSAGPGRAELWRRAAEAGIPDGQHLLAVSLSSAIAKNDTDGHKSHEAYQLFLSASRRGHVPSQTCLGVCYFRGSGTPQDRHEAARWFRKADEEGSARAQCYLAWCYLRGEGVTEDRAEALILYRKAAEQGYAPAQHKLAGLILDGTDVVADEAEAMKWYRKAAEQGYAPAQKRLAACLWDGKGVVEDKAEAARWYRRAAEQGHADAQFKLGSCYAEGMGVEKDRHEAAKWLRMAERQRSLDAKRSLKRLPIGSAMWHVKLVTASVLLGGCIGFGVGMASVAGLVDVYSWKDASYPLPVLAISVTVYGLLGAFMGMSGRRAMEAALAGTIGAFISCMVLTEHGSTVTSQDPMATCVFAPVVFAAGAGLGHATLWAIKGVHALASLLAGDNRHE